MAPAALIAAAALVLGSPPQTGHAEPQPSDLDRRISAATQRLEVLVERHNAARSDLRATNARLRGATVRIHDLAGGVAAARQRVSAIAAWAYKTGPTSRVSAVLAADSPAALVDRLATVNDLARAEERQILGLADLSRRLAVDRWSLQTLAASQAERQAELSTLTAQVERDLAALRELRTRVAPTSRRARAPTWRPPPLPTVSGAAGRAVSYAYAQLGKPYRYGASGPHAYDCSGLTMASWRAAGVVLPHNAARQYSALPHVPRAELRPGDLVFYYGDIHHVAIYVGRGFVLHAPNATERIKFEWMDHAPIHGYGRPT